MLRRLRPPAASWLDSRRPSAPASWLDILRMMPCTLHKTYVDDQPVRKSYYNKFIRQS
jgi:hypothetical protein